MSWLNLLQAVFVIAAMWHLGIFLKSNAVKSVSHQSQDDHAHNFLVNWLIAIILWTIGVLYLDQMWDRMHFPGCKIEPEDDKALYPQSGSDSTLTKVADDPALAGAKIEIHRLRSSLIEAKVPRPYAHSDSTLTKVADDPALAEAKIEISRLQSALIEAKASYPQSGSNSTLTKVADDSALAEAKIEIRHLQSSLAEAKESNQRQATELVELRRQLATVDLQQALDGFYNLSDGLKEVEKEDLRNHIKYLDSVFREQRVEIKSLKDDRLKLHGMLTAARVSHNFTAYELKEIADREKDLLVEKTRLQTALEAEKTQLQKALEDRDELQVRLNSTRETQQISQREADNFKRQLQEAQIQADQDGQKIRSLETKVATAVLARERADPDAPEIRRLQKLLETTAEAGETLVADAKATAAEAKATAAQLVKDNEVLKASLLHADKNTDGNLQKARDTMQLDHQTLLKSQDRERVARGEVEKLVAEAELLRGEVDAANSRAQAARDELQDKDTALAAAQDRIKFIMEQGEKEFTAKQTEHDEAVAALEARIELILEIGTKEFADLRASHDKEVEDLNTKATQYVQRLEVENATKLQNLREELQKELEEKNSTIFALQFLAPSQQGPSDFEPGPSDRQSGVLDWQPGPSDWEQGLEDLNDPSLRALFEDVETSLGLLPGGFATDNPAPGDPVHENHAQEGSAVESRAPEGRAPQGQDPGIRASTPPPVTEEMKREMARTSVADMVAGAELPPDSDSELSETKDEDFAGYQPSPSPPPPPPPPPPAGPASRPVVPNRPGPFTVQSKEQSRAKAVKARRDKGKGRA